MALAVVAGVVGLAYEPWMVLEPNWYDELERKHERVVYESREFGREAASCVSGRLTGRTVPEIGECLDGKNGDLELWAIFAWEDAAVARGKDIEDVRCRSLLGRYSRASWSYQEAIGRIAEFKSGEKFEADVAAAERVWKQYSLLGRRMLATCRPER